MELPGKTAIVTGSARGIGEGIAVAMAKAGARVVINSRKEKDCMEILASDRADMITGQSLAVDGGILTGFGEDLRPIIRQRMADMQAKHP